MRKSLVARLLTAASVAGAASLLFAVGSAAGAIPDSNHVFTACMFKDVGTIRLIDPSLPAKNLLGHCSKLEEQVQWNQQGPKGDTGPAAPIGPQGSKGDTGATGPQGPQGADGGPGTDGKDGATGATGPQGPKGDDGAAGSQGPAGPPGPNGAGVLNVSLDPGDDPACPQGGAKFTVPPHQVSYACSGAPGATGPQGPSGSVGGTGRVSDGDAPVTVGTIPGMATVTLSPSPCQLTFHSTTSQLIRVVDVNTGGTTGAAVGGNGTYTINGPAAGMLTLSVTPPHDPIQIVNLGYSDGTAVNSGTGVHTCSAGFSGTST